MSRLYRFNFNCGLRCWLAGWLVVGAVFERTLPVRPGAREGGRGVTRRGLKASIGSAYVRKNGHVEWNEARFEVETLLSLSLYSYTLLTLFVWPTAIMSLSPS